MFLEASIRTQSLNRATHNCLLAEASCSSAVRVAKNVVRDFGKSVSRSSGLEAVSKCGARSAERDTHRLLVKKFRLSLPVPISKLGRGRLSHSVLRLTDWMQFLVSRNCWHIVTGLVRPDAAREAAILKEFWRRFQASNPEHPVFELASEGSIQLEHTAPLLFHGDEGRGRRRQPFLCTSFFSMLGRGIRAGLRAQDRTGVRKEYLKLKPNFVGHSYTHRFLQAALPKAVFEDEVVFNEVLKQCAEEARLMSSRGVTHPYTKQKKWAVLLGITGDWAFLFKSGRLSRSYNNVQKHTTETAHPQGICHLCNAGQRNIPFEEISVRRPTWLATFSRDSPFQEPSSPLNTLLHAPGMQATIYKFDLWHSWHLGVGKSFIGSVLALMSMKYPGRSKDARFLQLSDAYLAWCRATSHPSILTRLTKETINWESNTTFPQAGWFKGALTTTMCAFVQDQLGPDGPEIFRDEMLGLCGEAILAINKCLKGLYENDVFLSPATANDIGQLGLKFLRRYSTLARKAADNNQLLFPLLPKLHCLHHLFLQDLVIASSECSWVVNPICYSVQVSEDMIGQLSRLSRRVHPNKCSQRCIERHLQLAYSKYVKEGFLVEGQD